MKELSKKLQAIQPSATLVINTKAKQLKAEGKNVISFGAGEPDFPTPTYIVNAAIQAAKDPSNHKYSPTSGLPALKKAIAEKTKRDSGYDVNPNNILVTNGGKQAVFQAFASILNENDEIIIPAPYWTTYPQVATLCGAKTIKIQTTFETNFKITIKDLQTVLTNKTKALLLCSPSNPTGAVYTKEELEKIGKWCLKNQIWIITDEIYEHLVYEDSEKLHILKIVPELENQTIVVNGVAKTYAMTGWRVGWLTAPEEVVKLATNFQSHLTSNVCNIAQMASLEALNSSLDTVEKMRKTFDKRRKIMITMLNEIDGIKLSPPKGAFYCFPNIENFIGKTLRGEKITSSKHLASLILQHALVAVVPGEAFGTTGYIRLSYALNDKDLIEGMRRIQQLFKEIK